MIKQNIFNPLGLINVNNLEEDEKFICSVHYEMFPEERVGVYVKGRYFVIHFVSWNPFKKKWGNDQKEFPLASLPWIVDRFENGFFKAQNQGGVSDVERSFRKEFEGELIGLNVMIHCCAENLPGFNIWNGNRKSYISDVTPQQWDIPRYMLLEQGLLAQLKSFSEEYVKGKL